MLIQDARALVSRISVYCLFRVSGIGFSYGIGLMFRTASCIGGTGSTFMLSCCFMGCFVLTWVMEREPD